MDIKSSAKDANASEKVADQLEDAVELSDDSLGAVAGGVDNKKFRPINMSWDNVGR